MKRSLQALAVLLLLWPLVGSPARPVAASPARQVEAINPAEAYVLAEILADGDADLSQDPAFANDADRKVRASFIVALWQDPDVQKKTFFKLWHATLTDDLRAEGLSLPFNVEFHNCLFEGGLNLSSTSVRTFRIDDSTVEGSVKMDRMQVQGDLALYQSTFTGGVTLFGANISNNLFAKASTFLSTSPVVGSAFPFELWTTSVGQTTEFTQSTFQGEVKADDAKFGVDLRFNEVVFEAPAHFNNIEVGNLANFHAAQFKGLADFDSSTFGLDANFAESNFGGQATFSNMRVTNKANFQNVTFYDQVSFESSIMDRDAAFTGSAFQGPANFNYLAVTRFLDLDQTTFTQGFSFVYTVVGWPYFKGATFNGRVDFEGMQASHDFDLTDATYNNLDQPFTVTLVGVDGQVLMDDFAASAGLSLEHNRFGDLSLSGRAAKTFSFINLSATTVDGDFDLSHVQTREFIANGLTVQDSTTFTGVVVESILDMGNANIGFFTMDDQFTWPKDPKSFNLRGLTYSDIGLVNGELDENTWRVLLRMVDESAYSPQAYRTLAQFLADKGQPEWAAEVELSRKERERDKILTPGSVSWFWSWFLYTFSGYGQRPDFAFIWSALVITIGAIIFRREQDMVIVDTSEARPRYNPVLYSFALFLPYIDLGIASKWEPRPNRPFAATYKHIHRLLGWILMPIALLTFGGIL